MEMYQQFYKEISAASGIYEVHMYREQKDIVLEQEIIPMRAFSLMKKIC